MNENGLDKAQNSQTENFMALEQNKTGRAEFTSAKLLARSGSNRWHNLIVANTAVSIGSKMHTHKCEMYISNMQVKLANNYICTPDIAIVNGDPKFADANAEMLLNPTVVVEIFSSTTDTADKTKKVESFLEMESIRECLLLKQDEMRVEHYSRQNARQWLYRIYNERDDVISLDSIGTKVSLSEVYAQIKFQHAQLASKAVN